MSFVEKLITPDFYKTKWNGLMTAGTRYYQPMFRAGSITPLWHIMVATSVVMYTATYVAYKGPKIQARRAVEKEAVAEYDAKHGTGGHH